MTFNSLIAPSNATLLSPEEAVFSNIDGMLDDKIVERLKAGGLVAQHSAWDFCGYVWYDQGIWVEEVWVNHEPVAVYEGDTPMAVIEQANLHHGSA